MKAPGTEKSTTFLPPKSCSVLRSWIPSVVGTLSVAAGSLSPTWIAIVILLLQGAGSEVFARDVVERVEHAVAHGDRERLEPIALARTGDAEAVVDAEQRAVGRAHEVAPLAIEELVGRPVERRSDVRTAIHVRVARRRRDARRASAARGRADAKPRASPSAISSTRHSAVPTASGKAQPSAFSIAATSAGSSGAVGGAKRASTAPSRPITNFPKFHLTSPALFGADRAAVSHA